VAHICAAEGSRLSWYRDDKHRASFLPWQLTIAKDVLDADSCARRTFTADYKYHWDCLWVKQVQSSILRFSIHSSSLIVPLLHDNGQLIDFTVYLYSPTIDACSSLRPLRYDLLTMP
jgi:hypothetical protein